MSQNTIAELLGSSPSPARKRFASARSCSWIASTPTRSITSSAAAVATHMNQAGEVSSRRALVGEAKRPAEERLQRILSRVPAGGMRNDGVSMCSGRIAMNAVPRGDIIHL